MNEIESRLAAAMRARANDVEPEDEHAALDHITQRVNVNRRRGLALLSAAAAIVVVVGAIAFLNRDDGKNPQHITTATNPGDTTTTTTNTPPSVIPQFDEQAIWPFASSSQTFTTPEAAAKSFAVEYLGMRNARVGNACCSPDTAFVEIFPNDRSTAATVVHVRPRPHGDKPSDWIVTSADSDQITVDTPKPNDPLSSSLTISGKSVAFEATLGIQLRPLDSTTPVFQGNTNGGSTDMQPFSTTISPPATDQPLVLVVFEGDASGAGDMTKATVIPLSAAGAPQPTSFYAVTSSGDRVVLDFQGHVQRTLTAADEEFPVATTSLPSNVTGTLATLRGRFGTVAFFDGTNIASYNPTTNAQVKLVTPAAAPVTLDADESGRYLIWVDVNHDLWTWSGADPLKVGSGFASAAW